MTNAPATPPLASGSTEIPRVPRRSRAAFWILVAALVIATALAAVLAWFARSPGPFTGPAVVVEISPGARLRGIARVLREQQIISHEALFVALATATRSRSRLRAGEYEFAAGVTPIEVLSRLRSGLVRRHWITIPEGWTLAQMADLIARESIAPAEKFLALAADPGLAQRLGVTATGLEGYCFPDTYAFIKNTPPEMVLRTMVSRFHRVFAAERAAAGDPSRLGLTDHEVVILASIVEKETARPDERPLIAGTFLNRLHRGIPLASDPTVIYGIPHFNGNLTRSDLESPTPYNTYVRAGLPPGPIANPGRAALRAALDPAPVDYLYFVSRNDGSHQFSRTLEEHNRAVREFQSPGRRTPAAPPS